MSLLIHNIFLEDLKCLISDQNSELEGGNKAHKHSGGIGSNIPKKEKMRNSGREGGGTLTVSREEGGSATAIKGEGVMTSCSSDSDWNALLLVDSQLTVWIHHRSCQLTVFDT